jgi:hypothetical protein
VVGGGGRESEVPCEKSVTKSVSLLTEISYLTKKIINYKYNTHIKYKI